MPKDSDWRLKSVCTVTKVLWCDWIDIFFKIKTVFMNIIPGPVLRDNICVFNVWAPEKDRMRLLLLDPEEKEIEMERVSGGYFTTTVEGLTDGVRYLLIPGDADSRYPDPASQHQPEGVLGPSAVVDHTSYEWRDAAWRGIPFKDLVFYELHVGTFTSEGTFDAVISRLDDLADTGINAIELMPVAQFPGGRNWGYDGVFPFAPQNTYGGPTGLKRLVDACHARGIAVFLDVVYNHLGPEGNCLRHFGPYFTDKYATPWGEALNFDGEWSDGVREYFCANAAYWCKEYHMDGLRFDAIHAIFDQGAVPFLQLVNRRMTALAERLGRPLYMIAESDLNDPRVVVGPELNGLGFRAQWLDDFHHALYTLLDDSGQAHFKDFGSINQLIKAYTDGFVHSGEFVSFRKRRHGASSAAVPGDRFLAFIQNHDQIGNRVLGDRISSLTDEPRCRLAAAAVLLAPYLPLLFMGEEYAEDAPFCYFVSHSGEELIRAVQEGRKREFSHHLRPGQNFPDPQDEQTFERSKLCWEKRSEGRHARTLNWYARLLRLRRELPALTCYERNSLRAWPVHDKAFALLRSDEAGTPGVLALFNFSTSPIPCLPPAVASGWRKVLDSTASEVASETADRQVPDIPDYCPDSKSLLLPPLSVAAFASTR
jgi:maltooligosyltrehalose trehalohydrolase